MTRCDASVSAVRAVCAVRCRCGVSFRAVRAVRCFVARTACGARGARGVCGAVFRDTALRVWLKFQWFDFLTICCTTNCTTNRTNGVSAYCIQPTTIADNCLSFENVFSMFACTFDICIKLLLTTYLLTAQWSNGREGHRRAGTIGVSIYRPYLYILVPLKYLWTAKVENLKFCTLVAHMKYCLETINCSSSGRVRGHATNFKFRGPQSYLPNDWSYSCQILYTCRSC